MKLLDECLDGSGDLIVSFLVSSGAFQPSGIFTLLLFLGVSFASNPLVVFSEKQFCVRRVTRNRDQEL